MFKLKNQDFSNNNVLHRNRKAPRTHFYPFSDVKSALTTCVKNSNCIIDLNGEWMFKWFDSPFKIDESVINKTEGFNNIVVPINWQYAGYGKNVYTDLWYPFPMDPPYIPAENETGVYKKKIDVTKDMMTNISIRFEGVESAYHVYINGQMVGYSQGSRLPAEFDITNYVHIGENEICVVVYQYCDGTYLEDQDMWWLGGIIRDVYLICRPNIYLENVILDPDYDIVNHKGILNINISLIGNGSVDIEVYKSDNLLTSFKNAILNQNTKLYIDNIEPWTAETPNLYKIIAVVKDKNNNVCEVVSQNIGFRHIEIIDGQLQVNGKKIFMKGVNRHEYNAKKGRVVTYQEAKEELQLIKKSGMNAIRTAHYPNNPFTYDICDEIGLYVIDECDLETHGFEIVGQDTRLCNDNDWKAAYIDRVERMVQRDRNHACIIVWSLGNESGYGDNFRAMYDWCKLNEPTRPVHYEGDYKNQSVDVSSTMYSTIGRLKEIDIEEPKRPHILCEFAHAMGNGPGSLREYFEVCENSNRIQGVFVWELKDHGIYSRSEDGKEMYKYGGMFGERFHNGNFCMDGLIMANGNLSPGFYEYSKVIENIHVIKFDKENSTVLVKNRFDYLDTEKIILRCSIKENEKEIDSFNIKDFNIESQSIKSIKLGKDLEKYYKNNLVTIDLEFVFDDDCGCYKKHDVAGTHREILCNYSPNTLNHMKPANVEVAQYKAIVKGDNFSFILSFVDGRIYDYYYNNKLLIEKGPILNYFRAFTDNDVKNAGDWNLKHLHSMRQVIYEVNVERLDSETRIYLKGKFSPQGLDWATNIDICYQIIDDGSIYVNYDGKFQGNCGNELPKIGTQMQLPKEYSNVLYSGFGPDECYCDSKEHTSYGIYKSDYIKMQTNYIYPQENGNRTGVNWFVIDNDDMGIAVGSINQKDFSVRDIEDYDLYKCNHEINLNREDYLLVNFDYKNSGLGSGSCGPVSLSSYKAYTIPYNFGFSIVPFDNNKDLISLGHKALDFEKTIINKK